MAIWTNKVNDEQTGSEREALQIGPHRVWQRFERDLSSLPDSPFLQPPWWSQSPLQLKPHSVTNRDRTHFKKVVNKHQDIMEIISNHQTCVHLMLNCTHRSWHGLLDLFVAYQLNVSIFIVMNLEHWKVPFSLTLPEQWFNYFNSTN